MSPDERTALVTGASSGVGRAIAIELAAAGFDVALVGRDAARLSETAGAAREHRAVANAYVADVADESALRTLRARVLRDFAGIDLLVHAAGIIAFGDVESTEIEALDRQYKVNLRAPCLLTQLLLPTLKQRRGQVVFVNSTAGLAGSGGTAAYAATKAGLRAFADSLRAEVNDHGVRVLSMFLGRTATPMQEAVHAREGRAYEAVRLIQPEDVAALLVAVLRLPATAEVTEIRVRPAQRPLPLASASSTKHDDAEQPVTA